MQQNSEHKKQIAKLNRFIRTLSLFKVPLLRICGPEVIELDSQKAVVKLPHKFVTKNHLGSMYFGALSMGAELSIALRLLDRMRREKVPVSFIFKDFNCEFHKRAETDVHFVTEEVALIDKLIDEAASQPERVNGTFKGYAVSAVSGEKLMSYQLTISMKRFQRRQS